MEMAVPSTPPQTDLDAHESRRAIVEAIQEQTEKLFRTLCVYVKRGGLARGEEIPKVATELLSEVVERALRHAHRFDPSRQAMAWLLGIASNVILQEKHKRIRQQRREPFLQDLVKVEGHDAPEEFVARSNALAQRSIDERLASHDQAEKILSRVSAADRQIIQMSVLQQLTAKEIAQQTGSTPGAIRVRLFRALKRLRSALEQEESHELLAR